MPKIEEVLPKYLQIANNLRDRILGGEMQPGDEVPSERQLSADWGVSRPTATRALETMRVWGLVMSRQGSGTYVIDQGPLNRRARERYVKSRQTGRIYGPGERAEIVAAEWAEAPEHAGAELLEQDVVRRDEALERVAPGRLLQVEDGAALSAV